MAVCDYCGVTYRGGAIKDGPYKFCTGPCRDHGRVLLERLDHIPEDKIESYIAGTHEGPCASCGQRRGIDFYLSYRIWSAFVYSRWQTKSHILCRNCARRRQIKDLMFCIFAGWWSLPGFLITPFQITFNIIAMLRTPNPAVPSERLRKIAKLDLARKLGSQPPADTKTLNVVTRPSQLAKEKAPPNGQEFAMIAPLQRGISMRRAILFVVAIGLLISGFYLLAFEIFYAQRIYFWLAGGAGVMIWLGLHLLWEDFLAPLFRLKRGT